MKRTIFCERLMLNPFLSLFLRTLWIFSLLLAAVPAGGAKETPVPDCAIDAGPCIRTVEGMTVTLDITPKPVKAMQDLSFSLRLARSGRLVGNAKVEIDLAMPGMQMGRNRVQLQQGADGVYQGRGVIVRCPSGRTLWKASVVVTEGERSVTAEYLFEAP